MTATLTRDTTTTATDVAPLHRAVVAVAAAKVAFFMAIAGVWGIHRDEFYYLAGGRRLDWAYVDHPPLTPLLYRVGETLFGDSQVGLRTLPAILAGVLVVVSALIARELGGGRTAQLITAIGVAVSPMFLTTSHFLSTVTLDILLWSIGLLLVARLLRTRDTRLWLLIGVVAAVGLLNKNTMLFWGIGVVAGLVWAKEWMLLRSRWLLGGVAIAGLAMVPYVLWQIHYDWPTIEFLRSLQSHDDMISNPLLYFPFQLVLLGPVLALVWIPGLVSLVRSRDMRRFRALGLGYLVILVLIFFLRGKAYYVGSWYPTLFAAGAVRLESAGRPLRRLGWLVAVTSVIAMFFAVPLVPSTSDAAKAVVGANDELGEMLGWDDMAHQVADIAHRLPAADQANLTIYTQNYSEAGAIEYWHDDLGLPQPISEQNNYWIWGFGPAHENGTAITIGLTAEQMRPFFDDVLRAGTVTNAAGIHNKEYGNPILICRGQRVPWAEIWRQTRNFS
jgi:hypothetical protein